jgi:hypothetical protein
MHEVYKHIYTHTYERHMMQYVVMTSEITFFPISRTLQIIPIAK